MYITIIGNVCVDKNTSENASYTAPGGPAIFMDKVFAKLAGVKTTIVTPYGKDFQELAPSLPLFPNEPTTQDTLIYENVSKNGVREQKAYNRENAHPVDMSPQLEHILTQSDILFFTPLLPGVTDVYAKQVKAYAGNALTVLLPQGYYRQFSPTDAVIHRNFIESSKILPLVDVVVVSEQDGKDMLHTAHMWARIYDILVVVTLGEKGAVAIQKNITTQLPTTPVLHTEVVDSVGAGDIFSASFAYAYKKTGNIEKAGEYANRIARARLFFPADKILLDPRILEI